MFELVIDQKCPVDPEVATIPIFDPGHNVVQKIKQPGQIKRSFGRCHTARLGTCAIGALASPSERPNFNGTSGCGKRFWPTEQFATGYDLGRVEGVAPYF